MARVGGAGSPSFSSSSSSSNSSSIFQNYPLISALVAFALAQSTKFFTTWYKERRWDLKRLVGSGGMPSSHSATVIALAIAVGFQDGFGSSLFAGAIVFACVVMYDAFGVRLHAGKQAELLNQIVYELPAEHPLAETRPLRELLGHTHAQIKAYSVTQDSFPDGARRARQSFDEAGSARMELELIDKTRMELGWSRRCSAKRYSHPFGVGNLGHDRALGWSRRARRRDRALGRRS